jgi:hypothetical protein
VTDSYVCPDCGRIEERPYRVRLIVLTCSECGKNGRFLHESLVERLDEVPEPQRPEDWDELPLVVADETQEISVGYSHAPHDHTTVSSGTLTLDEADGAFQKLVNGGAFTLEPPANDTSILLKVTNNATAGTITTTAFTKVTGDSLTTADGDKFLLNVEKFDGDSALHVRALQ